MFVDFARLVDKIFNFELEIVLFDPMVRGIFEKLYVFIKENCPTYFV